MVLVILVLMATLGVMGVDGYLERAEQTARDNVARAIFMAAQTSLTHEYNQDRDFFDNNNYVFIPGDQAALADFLPEGEAEKQLYAPDAQRSKQALVYLVMNKGADNSGQPLYGMLAPYINDKSVLNDSILIEFNRETGMMLSAFYSEADGVTFGYGTGGSYDVSNRDAASLQAALVGFYGVDSTGDPFRVNPIDDTDYTVMLVDHVDHRVEKYGLLTAEIDLPPELDPNYIFALKLIPQLGAPETVTFAAQPIGDDDNVDFYVDDLTAEQIDTPQKAIEDPRVISENRAIPVYRESSATVHKLVFILDGVQSFGTNARPIAIKHNYPGIGGGFLSAELRISDGADATVLYSEDYSDTPVHAFYGSDSDETTLAVRSVRHLNNVRYCEDDSSFSQRQSIYMLDYALNGINFTPLCNRLDAWEKPDGTTDHGFYGTYTSHASFAIFDLHIDLTVQENIPENPDEDDETLYNAGLFDTIRHDGEVKNVRFAMSTPWVNDAQLPYALRGVLEFGNDEETSILRSVASVKGVEYAGGIAAVNEGTIENCTMLGYVSADMAGRDDGTAGGITGSNEYGAIRRCATACTVSANKRAGGIAGKSSGSIRLCEAGTASWRSAENSRELFLSGAAFYGAADGDNNVYRSDHTSNNTFRIKIEESDGIAGGIAGELTGTPVVYGCVNACKVESGNLPGGTGGGEQTGGVAGGIVGQLFADDTNETAVGYNCNAGAVYATESAGGIVGEVMRGKIAFCYNTGYVNWEYEALHYSDDDVTYFMPGITRNLSESTVNRSGGLLGSGSDQTVIEDCYSMQYTGDQYGGAFGILDRNARVENCSFLKNILNNTGDYYDGDGRNDIYYARDNSLDMYSVENMRKAPSDGNLGAYFSDGSFTAPAGVFKFKFPRLTSTSEGQPLPTHRTPWNPTIEEYGKIEFTQGSLTSAGSEIICAFYLAPPEGRIVLKTNSADAGRATTVIPLGEAAGWNSLGDCRRVAGSGEWLELYGYDNETTFDSAHRNYTVQIRARKLDATNDAILIARGYTYRYDLRLYYANWNEGGQTPYHTAIPADTTRLVAELYNTHKDESRGYVDEAVLGNEALRLVDPSIAGVLVQACALEMDLGHANGQSVRITMTYDGGGVQVIELPNNVLNSAPGSYAEAMFQPTRWARLQGSDDTRRYPFYVENNNVCLVLWVDYILPAPNYLLADNCPVTVLVEKYRGSFNSGNPTTYTRRFDTLEPE